jgi:hypothetical protein
MHVCYACGFYVDIFIINNKRHVIIRKLLDCFFLNMHPVIIHRKKSQIYTNRGFSFRKVGYTMYDASYFVE